jgi:hypothetical protein
MTSPCLLLHTLAGRFCAGLLFMSVPFVSVACSHLQYSPAPVVPAKQPLPYSATVTVGQVEAYTVRPGAVLTADPAMAHQVTSLSDVAAPSRADWEHAILRYLQARKTFARVTPPGPADVELIMHVNVYIDPSVDRQFREVYMARVDALVTDPRTRVVYLSFTGEGKSPRHDRDEAYQPVNQVVQAALNDLFGKMEQDSAMLRLGAGSGS